MGLYTNGHTAHADSIFSFLAENGSSVGDKISHHGGWEIILGGSPNQKGIEIEVSGRRYDMAKTPCLVYNGREEHHEFFQNPNLSLKALVIREEVIDSRLQELTSAKDFSFQCEPSAKSKIAELSSSIYSLLRNDTLSRYETTAVTDCLLLELIDNQPHNRSSIKQELANTSLNYFLFKEILVQIHANAFKMDFDLSDLSQQLGVSKFHIVRTTKRLGGFTPHSYLLKVRLHRARSLLIETNLPIGSIASDCGFEDLSTFNKAFKRMFSVPPSTCRLHKHEIISKNKALPGK